MRPSPVGAATAFLWIAAVGLIGVGLFGVRRTPAPRLADLPLVEDAEQVGTDGRLIGAPDAPLRIVEFMDFQCPYCRIGADRLQKLQQRYPGRLTIVMRHFPIGLLHPHALDAALASECAAEQGHFEAVRSVLLQYQDSIGVAGWAWVGAHGGVADVAAFEGCIRDQRYLENIQRDVEVANRLGIRATPAYVFDGRLLVGVRAIDRIEETLAGLR